MSSFSLSQDFVLDIKAELPSASLSIRDGDVVNVTALTDTDMGITGLDLKSLYLLYIRTGTLALQHLLDNSGSFNFSSDILTVDDDGDGTADVTVDSPL